MGESRSAVEKVMPQQEGVRRGSRVTGLNTTPRVCHPALPSGAGVAATVSAVMEERRRKSIPFLYPDILFLHELCKLISREQKEVSSVTETVEIFQIQWYSDKEWNNTAFMRFSRSTFFYGPYLVVSQIGSYSFLNMHRTDMRRFHLCGQWFQGVAMCVVLIELRWCVSTLWKTVSSKERFMGTDAAANAAQCGWLFSGSWGTLQNLWKLVTIVCLWSLSAWMRGQ